MKLLAMLLCLNFFNTTDVGDHGRYRVEITTTEGHQLKAYITISTYGELQTDFETDDIFKKYLFELEGYEDLDSLTFCRQLRYINYPPFDNDGEQLIANLDRDWISLAKSDIAKLKFVAFKPLRRVALSTKLTGEEIMLFQKEPFYVGTFSIDSQVEKFTGLWVLSYNYEMEEEEVNEIITAIKEAYEARKVVDDYLQNFGIYENLFLLSQKKLWDYGIYLLRVEVI